MDKIIDLEGIPIQKHFPNLLGQKMWLPKKEGFLFLDNIIEEVATNYSLYKKKAAR